MAGREDQRRGVIDTSVLAAGIAGFKLWRDVRNPSASLLRDWIENATFTWLVTEDILAEYKEVLARLGVRRNLIGQVINRLREEAEFVEVRFATEVSPDPDDNPFCACAEQGRATFIASRIKAFSSVVSGRAWSAKPSIAGVWPSGPTSVARACTRCHAGLSTRASLLEWRSCLGPRCSAPRSKPVPVR